MENTDEAMYHQTWSRSTWTKKNVKLLKIVDEKVLEWKSRYLTATPRTRQPKRVSDCHYTIRVVIELIS